MRTIPVNLILHALADRLAEHPDPHHALAVQIRACAVDHRALAEEWCAGAGTEQHAEWILRRILGAEHHTPIPPHTRPAAETRAMEVAVARRLADVGLSLLVTQDAEDRSAATLLLDASRLVVGLERMQAAADESDLPSDTAVLAMWRAWGLALCPMPPGYFDRELRAKIDHRLALAEGDAKDSAAACDALRAELSARNDIIRNFDVNDHGGLKALGEFLATWRDEAAPNAGIKIGIAARETILRLAQERDAARAEIETLKADLRLRTDQIKDISTADTKMRVDLHAAATAIGYGAPTDLVPVLERVSAMVPKSGRPGEYLHDRVAALIESRDAYAAECVDLKHRYDERIAALTKQREDLEVNQKRARDEAAAMRAAWHTARSNATRMKADLDAIHSAYREAANTPGTIPEIIGAIQRGATWTEDADRAPVEEPPVHHPPKFKVGDLVRFHHAGGHVGYGEPPSGWMGIIKEYDGIEPIPYRVQGPHWSLDRGEPWCWCAARDLTLVTSA